MWALPLRIQASPCNVPSPEDQRLVRDPLVRKRGRSFLICRAARARLSRPLRKVTAEATGRSAATALSKVEKMSRMSCNRPATSELLPGDRPATETRCGGG